ncbi:MAG TPA: YggT family protein [Thermomicrobiales bacterium]|nr:YggT family protein [Thermomicrobiales bacterium]
MSDITGILNLLFTVLSLAVIARALLSWFDPGMRYPVSQLLVDLTEPIIAPIRRIVPPVGGMIDLSPLIALILLQVIERVIIRSLNS